MNSYYGFIGKFIAKPGKRDELLANLLDAAEAMKGNAGCLLFVLGKSDTEPGAVWSNEIWTNKEAHDASLEPDEVKRQIAKSMPLIESMGGTTELAVVGGKGL
jgi:quinol monooxygenase YgiN